MQILIFFYVILLFSTPLPAVAAENTTKAVSNQQQVPSVLSIIPAQGEPGTKITMSGHNFGTDTVVFLGSIPIRATIFAGTTLEFFIPNDFKEGVYALYLQRKNGISGRPYNFTVSPLRPILNSLSPESIPSCNAGKEREITAKGKNFTESSQLFFDGMMIGSRFQSAESISFTVPQVAGGLHQITVKNSPENSSVTMGLMIETRPEISHVTIGNEFVNYYELIVEGKNFQQNSTLLVDGNKIGTKGEDLGAREKVIYMGCTKLIYQRHPYSPTIKEFRLQAVNSGGDGSQVVTVNAP